MNDNIEKMHLDSQEKNALYFSLLSIMKEQADLKYAAKEMFDLLIGLWDNKVAEIYERDSDLPTSKKKGLFRRVE